MKNNKFLPLACRVCTRKATNNVTFCGTFYVANILPTEKRLEIRCATCNGILLEVDLPVEMIKKCMDEFFNTTFKDDLANDISVKEAMKIINDIADDET